jgi:low temperature requirement protein LtrA
MKNMKNGTEILLTVPALSTTVLLAMIIGAGFPQMLSHVFWCVWCISLPASLLALFRLRTGGENVRQTFLRAANIMFLITIGGGGLLLLGLWILVLCFHQT